MICRKMPIFITLIILINIYIIVVAGGEFYDTRDDEIDKLLKKLNKPAIKSIKSPDGDIIDCVHMKNHPIYDDPLFKNHTIQTRPSSYPEGRNDESSNNEKHSVVTQLWTINGKCPENSIPIRRTRREDILQLESIERVGKKDPSSIPQPKPTNPSRSNETHEHAILIVQNTYGKKFYGAKALINVWKPYIQTKTEFSLAQIWIVAGTFSGILNTIEVGWQAYPLMYGDDNPRYFIYWTRDGYKKTGCYNLNCAGFVATNRKFVLGGAVSRVSRVDGPQEAFLTTIWMDRRTGNWWLKLGSNLIVGYWPASLFTGLQNGATEIHWGGEILDALESSQHTKTTMGSGRFAQEGWKKASFFNNLEIIDETNTMKPPKGLFPAMSKPNCYNITSGFHPRPGHFFYFGGPGRSPGCN